MSMRSPILAFCLTLSAIAPAFALDCADETQVVQDMCADASYQKADAALNRSYKEILHRLKDDSATTKLLVEAQKAWIAYRDANALFQAPPTRAALSIPWCFRSAWRG
jgi:uncharacterized protein YecT (DUF1311 family)